MATLAEVEAHRRAVADIAGLAQRDLVSFWRTVQSGSAPAIARAVREFLPDLLDVQGEAAAVLAADWYDELRDAAGAAGAFSSQLADPPPAEQVDAIARWAVTPVFSATPDPTAALSLLSGGVQRLVAGMDRQTLIGSAAADPAGTRWARHASANCCAFCGLLATRGAVYRTAERAGEGHRFHAHCHCSVVVAFPGQDVPRAPYVDRFDTAYADATRATGGTNTSAVLAHMRQSLGAA